jgi:hypothetical protein
MSDHRDRADLGCGKWNNGGCDARRPQGIHSPLVYVPCLPTSWGVGGERPSVQVASRTGYAALPWWSLSHGRWGAVCDR